MLALRPEGCVGEACGGGAWHRPTEDVAWLLAVAVALLAGAAVSLRPFAARRWAVAGAALLAVGAILLVAGAVVNMLLSGDSPLWWLHDSDSLGRVVPVAGSGAVGIGLMRARAQRPVALAGAGLVAAAVLSFGFNAQDDRVLLIAPLGVAWVAAGVVAARARR